MSYSTVSAFDIFVFCAENDVAFADIFVLIKKKLEKSAKIVFKSKKTKVYWWLFVATYTLNN